MALPSSGQLALSQISDEFGGGSRTNVSLRTLSAAANLSAPDGFNEFYGLASYTPPSYVSGASSISGSGTTASPYIIGMNWSRNTVTDYPVYDGIQSWEEVITNYMTMTDINFTNNYSGQQRAYIQYNISGDGWCNYYGSPWYYGEYYLDYPDITPIGHTASSYLYFYGSFGNLNAYGSSADGITPLQGVAGQSRNATFTKSVGQNIFIGASGSQDTWMYSYGFSDYVQVCGSFGNANTTVTGSLSLWFEKV